MLLEDYGGPYVQSEQYTARLEFCKEVLRNQPEALWGKPKLQWRFQDIGSATMTRCLPWKSAACGGPDAAEPLCVLQAVKLEMQGCLDPLAPR